jgi:uncharacterized protein
MKIDEIHELLEATLSRSVDTAPQGTALGTIAGKVRLMAGSYESDGLSFLASGDEVNAWASFWYAFGWLHFGYAYGLITGPRPLVCPAPGSGEKMSAGTREMLNEKTLRYMRLIRTASASVTSSPEQETVSGEFSSRVLFIADVFSEQGARYILSGMNEDALACFSYGHGWLDAAVISGLFQITGERNLFTV